MGNRTTATLLTLLTYSWTLGHLHCASSRPDGDLAVDTFPIKQDLESVEKPSSEECGEEPLKCSRYDRIPGDTLCFTSGYLKYIFLPPYEPKGWGKNACEAKRQLVDRLCHLRISPTSVDRVQCLPDPSSGHCPPKIDLCPETDLPTKCIAKSYMEQPLDERMKIRSTAASRCKAMNELRALACQMRLDPERLSQISCVNISEVLSDCPPQVQACKKSYKPSICSVSRYDGAEISAQISSKGNSLCEAQAGLYFLACQRDLRPSKLGVMDCKSIVK